jgi:hypothetical protein
MNRDYCGPKESWPIAVLSCFILAELRKWTGSFARSMRRFRAVQLNVFTAREREHMVRLVGKFVEPIREPGFRRKMKDPKSLPYALSVKLPEIKKANMSLCSKN